MRKRNAARLVSRKTQAARWALLLGAPGDQDLRVGLNRRVCGVYNSSAPNFAVRAPFGCVFSVKRTGVYDGVGPPFLVFTCSCACARTFVRDAVSFTRQVASAPLHRRDMPNGRGQHE